MATHQELLTGNNSSSMDLASELLESFDAEDAEDQQNTMQQLCTLLDIPLKSEPSYPELQLQAEDSLAGAALQSKDQPEDDSSHLLTEVSTVSDCSADTKGAKGSSRSHMCSWPNCGKGFNSRWGLDRHYRIHTGEKPWKCDVPDCGKGFVDRAMLMRHMQTHSKERPFVCPHTDCVKAFKVHKHLEYHLKLHNNADSFACSVADCGKRFSNPSSLRIHRLLDHESPSSDSFVERRLRERLQGSNQALERCREKVAALQRQNMQMSTEMRELRKASKLFEPQLESLKKRNLQLTDQLREVTKQKGVTTASDDVEEKSPKRMKLSDTSDTESGSSNTHNTISPPSTPMPLSPLHDPISNVSEPSAVSGGALVSSTPAGRTSPEAQPLATSSLGHPEQVAAALQRSQYAQMLGTYGHMGGMGMGGMDGMAGMMGGWPAMNPAMNAVQSAWMHPAMAQQHAANLQGQWALHQQAAAAAQQQAAAQAQAATVQQQQQAMLQELQASKQAAQNLAQELGVADGLAQLTGAVSPVTSPAEPTSLAASALPLPEPVTPLPLPEPAAPAETITECIIPV